MMICLSILWYMALGSLAFAEPIFASTTPLYNLSSVAKIIVDTTTYARPFDHDDTKQNQLRASVFSKAQSMIASAADISKLTPTGIPMPNKRRVKHDLNGLPEEPAYYTMVLLVNGYDVTVPILRRDAADFCTSVSREMKGGASSTTISTSKYEPTEASKASEWSRTANTEPKTTEEATSDTGTDTPSPTVEPSSPSTKSRGSDLPTDTPSSSETPSISKTPTKKPGATVMTKTIAKTTPDHASTSLTTHNSVIESLDRSSEMKSSTKRTATDQSTTVTEEGSTPTTDSSTSLANDAGKSHDVSQLLAENSQAWASYSSYINDLRSHLSKQIPNTRIETPTSIKEPRLAKGLTTSANAPSETKAKVAARQQRQFSQAAGIRNLLPWFRPLFVRRRNSLGYHLYDSSEVEQVQGFSSKVSRTKRQTPLIPAHHNAADDQGKLGIVKGPEEDQTEPPSTTDPKPTSTKARGPPKPTFGFDPHPHPPSPTLEEPPRPSSTFHVFKSSTSSGAEPMTTAELGDSTVPAAPSSRPSGNATHTGPDNSTSSDARSRWPKNPFAEPVFWGAGAWYLGMAYWEGYQQARGEWGWGWTDGVCRWVGSVMVRYL